MCCLSCQQPGLLEGCLPEVVWLQHGAYSRLTYTYICVLQSGRLCVVVPAGDDGPPKGILLGASTGKSPLCA